MHDELLAELRGRVAVVGVGDVRRGDDGVGPLIATWLKKADVEHVVDSGVSPELDLWKIREIGPDCVLFIDAVDFGGSAGDVALLNRTDLREKGFDTHRAPLRLTMEYLEREVGCKCRLLAIQPKDVSVGAPMCEEVRRSAENMAEIIAMQIQNPKSKIQNGVGG